MSIKAVVFIPFLAFGVRSFNFCDFNSRHILCNATEVPTNVNKGFSVYPKNDFERNRILLSFNAIRRKVASGTFVRGNTQLPKAANLMRLEWCRECEKAAWNVIKDCAFDHSKLNCCDCTNTGQMYLSFLTVISPIGRKSRKFEVGNVLRDIVQYDEDFDLRCLYNVTRRDCFERESKFIMVSSDRVTHVGCAYKDCTNINYQDIFICFFGFNLTAALHRPLYVVGEPCSSCRMNSRCKEQSDFLCECERDKICYQTPFPLGESCYLSDREYPEYKDNIMNKEDYGIHENSDTAADKKMPPVQGRFLGALFKLIFMGIKSAVTGIKGLVTASRVVKAAETVSAAVDVAATIDKVVKDTQYAAEYKEIDEVLEYVGQVVNSSKVTLHDNLTEITSSLEIFLKNSSLNSTDEIMLRLLKIIMNNTKLIENSTAYYEYSEVQNATEAPEQENVTEAIVTEDVDTEDANAGDVNIELRNYEEHIEKIAKNPPKKNSLKELKESERIKPTSENNSQTVIYRSKNISLFLCMMILLII